MKTVFQPQYLICPQCFGRGYLKTQPCFNCQKQSSIYLFLDNYLIYFKDKINHFTISLRRIKKVIDFIINFCLLLLALAGLGFLIYYAYEAGVIESPRLLLTQNFWLKPQSMASQFLRLFFLSTILDCFLVYRLVREQEREAKVLKYKFKLEFIEIPESLTWEEVKNFSEKSIINMAGALSQEARQILEQAWLSAYERKHSEVLPLHLLAQLIPLKQSQMLFVRLGVDAKLLAEKTDKALAAVDAKTQDFSPRLSLPLVKIFLESYQNIYLKGGAKKIEVLDFWPGLVGDEILSSDKAVSEEESRAAELLYDFGLDKIKLSNVVSWIYLEKELQRSYNKTRRLSRLKPSSGIDRAMTAVATNYLNQFSQDLTLQAKRGFLPLSLGHKKELQELFTVLESGAKSLVLVGPPGIGKQSLIEEVALKMSAEQVPSLLQDKRLVDLSVSAVVAGGDPAQAENRLFKILQEASRSGNIIFFIKDIHNLVGKNTQGKDSLDVSEILAQGIESGHFTILATSSSRDYQKLLAGSTLGEILHKIEVKEPEKNEAVLMLEARVPFIESKQKVFFTYQALESAVELAQKLIHTGYLPEKALHILEETAAWVKSARGENQLATKQDVGKIVSQKVDMPLEAITEEESHKLLNLEEKIHQTLINQEEAVKAVANAMRRSRTELRDEKRPIANFLFVGPTGVGKTQLAKTLAKIYFGSEKDIIRLDMSEFQETESIDRLIGTLDQEGILTAQVKNNPFAVLLLDELEKANHAVFNIFLSVLDEGVLQSAQGEQIDFRNLIIIATSNAATLYIQKALEQGKATRQIKGELVSGELLKHFRPEFINRFDDVIVFRTLSPDHIKQIAVLMLKELQAQMEEKGVLLKVTSEALEELAHSGFDPMYGARPMRRAIQEQVRDALAKYLLQGKLGRRDVAVLDKGGEIRVERAKRV